MAGLDGVQNKIKPGEPLDKNIYELPPEELKKVPNVAGSLSEALDCLEKDHAFLLKGDVFTKDFLDMWISTKRKEHDATAAAPASVRVPPVLRRVKITREEELGNGADESPRRFCSRNGFAIIGFIGYA